MITKDNTLRVMELFFRYPERKFHLRELARLTSLSMPGVMKIVRKLEKEELLKSAKEKMVRNVLATRNEKFVSLKRAYNLYSIFLSGLLDFLKKEYEEPEAIVLFGSYAKGEDTSASDLDIAIVTRKELGLKLAPFEKALGRRIRLYEVQLVKAEKEFLNTLANGIILHGYLKAVP